MPQRTKDYTNPRLILRELHNILCSKQGWSDSDKKKLSRWVNSNSINENSNDLFFRLRDEIIIGLSYLFPVKTIDGINFIADSNTHPYVGQFFSSQIVQPFTSSLLPYLVNWIHELEKVKSKDKQKEVALEIVTGFLVTIVDNKKEIYSRTTENTYWMPDELLIDMMVGKYWFLPWLEDEESPQPRLILPIVTVLENFITLKEGVSTRIELVTDAVKSVSQSTNPKYDPIGTAYERLKKNLDRLLRGEGITIAQLNMLRKTPFSLLILGENWMNKDEKEKAKVIQGIASFFQLSEISPQFDKRWRKLKSDQVEVIKESLDGIFETTIVLAYLLGKVIFDLQKYYPDDSYRLAKIKDRPKLSQDLLSRLN